MQKIRCYAEAEGNKVNLELQTRSQGQSNLVKPSPGDFMPRNLLRAEFGRRGRKRPFNNSKTLNKGLMRPAPWTTQKLICIPRILNQAFCKALFELLAICESYTPVI